LEATDTRQLLQQPLIDEEEDYAGGNNKFKTALQEQSEAGFTSAGNNPQKIGSNQHLLDQSQENKHGQATNEDRLDQLLYLVNQKVESYKAEKERS